MQVDKEKLEKAAREVLGQVNPEMASYDFSYPDIQEQVVEKAGYDPEDLWEDIDDYTCQETELFWVSDDIIFDLMLEMGLNYLLDL